MTECFLISFRSLCILIFHLKKCSKELLKFDELPSCPEVCRLDSLDYNVFEIFYLSKLCVTLFYTIFVFCCCCQVKLLVPICMTCFSWEMRLLFLTFWKAKQRHLFYNHITLFTLQIEIKQNTSSKWLKKCFSYW